jgi:hypothetical protein
MIPRASRESEATLRSAPGFAGAPRVSGVGRRKAIRSEKPGSLSPRGGQSDICELVNAKQILISVL